MVLLNLVYSLIVLVSFLIFGIDYIADYLVEATAIKPKLLYINRTSR